MVELLYNLPLPISGAVIIVTMIGLTLGGLKLTRRFLFSGIRFGREHGHFSGPMIHSVMVFYGLVAALIAVNVFETHNNVASVASQEAASVAGLYRDASGYPEPARTEIQSELRDYIQEIIHVSWPLQVAGQIPTGGIPFLDRVQATLFAFQPANQSQSLLHGEALRAFNQLVDARRLRLDAVRSGLPGVMWLVVLLGAAVSIFASYLFPVDDGRMHELFLALVSLLIGMVLFMIFALDQPFRGGLGVTSEPYQLIYDQLMKK